MRGAADAEGWALLESLPPYDETEVAGAGERLRAAGDAAGARGGRAHPGPAAGRGRGPSSGRSPTACSSPPTAWSRRPGGRSPPATRSGSRRPASTRVADLGCGIGGGPDRAGRRSAARSSPSTATSSTAAVADAEPAALAGRRASGARTPRPTDLHRDAAAAFVDPARRRTDGSVRTAAARPRRRTHRRCSFVARPRGPPCPRRRVKVAPGIPHDAACRTGAEAEWVSVGGDVIEAGLWFGLARPDGVRRAALVLPAGPDGASDAVRAADVTDAGMPEPTWGRSARCSTSRTAP